MRCDSPRDEISQLRYRCDRLKMRIEWDIYIYVRIYTFALINTLLNFTRSWGFGIFRVYWVSKSKCIISSNLRAEGSSGKVLNVVIFVESMVHRSNWRSRETETVGNSRERPGVIMPKLSIRHFFCKKKNFPRHPIFF